MSLRDLRIAEVEELDMQLEEGEIIAYRAKLRISFKYHEPESHKLLLQIAKSSGLC